MGLGTDDDEVVAAYSARAAEYARKLGSLESTAQADRELIRQWCPAPGSTVLDLGCGPGHWTEFLRCQGVTAVGVEPSSSFLDIARSASPRCRFELGSAGAIPAEDGSVDAVLAWYSLIHLPARELGRAFEECRRVLRPGGSILVGFFEGPEVQSFAHAIAPAYTWPVEMLAELAENKGFRVVSTHTRQDPGARPHGDLTAVAPAEPTSEEPMWAEPTSTVV